MYRRTAGAIVAAISAMAAWAAADSRSKSLHNLFPTLGGGGHHASHWQGHDGEKRTARARAAKKVAHASRVRNRPTKAKKWSGKVTLKTRLYERRLNRLDLFEKRTLTTGNISPGSIYIEESEK